MVVGVFLGRVPPQSQRNPLQFVVQNLVVFTYLTLKLLILILILMLVNK